MIATELSDAMRRHVESGEVAGLVTVVCRDDKVHIEAIGVQDLDSKTPMQRDSIFRIASLSKPITAVGAMVLVEDGKMGLNDSIFQWLPELKDMKVLRSLDAEIDDTVPARRAITVHDLLAFTMGFGIVMAKRGTYPIQSAMDKARLMPGPLPPQVTAEQYLKNLGTLPLISQPGEQWLYHTGSDLLGILISRVAGMSLEQFLRERIFDPLGMKDTAFSVPPDKIDRLTTSYSPDLRQKLVVFDAAKGGKWASPPVFESGGGGLVSTADDLLAFGRMMLDGGVYGTERILKKETVAEMTTDQLTKGQKAVSGFYPGFWDTRGWGLGLAIVTAPDQYSAQPGRFGWDGGLGTSWCSHPAEDLVAILLTQRTWTSPVQPAVCADFWRETYEAIGANV